VTFISLLAHNVWRRRVRAIVTVVAVAIGVTAVLALGVLTMSLRETAVAVLKIGRADFSVSQEGASDVLYSTMSKEEIDSIRHTKGVESAIGVFVRTGHLSRSHPFFIEIGLAPSDQRQYGVQVVAGRSYRANASDEMMLGWRAAKDFGVKVGDRFKVEERTFRVVGIFSTNNPIGDAGGMYPIGPLQDWHTLPGVYTLAFVRVAPGANVDAVRKAVEKGNPRLATIRSES
jgi:ABC-type lipoprotein release transport system permease subunit